MDATDRLIKQTTRQPQKEVRVPIMDGMFLPNRSGIFEKIDMHGCSWSADATNVYLKTTAGTAILTINLTTGNMTLGGTQKRVICTKVVGA